MSKCEVEDRNYFCEPDCSSILLFFGDPEKAHIIATISVPSIPYIKVTPELYQFT